MFYSILNFSTFRQNTNTDWFVLSSMKFKVPICRRKFVCFDFLKKYENRQMSFERETKHPIAQREGQNATNWVKEVEMNWYVYGK